MVLCPKYLSCNKSKDEEPKETSSVISSTLRMVSDGAMGIVGVPQEAYEDAAREKWDQRRKIYLRRLSSVKPSSSCPSVPLSPSVSHADTGKPLHFSDIVQIALAESKESSLRYRQEHAGKLLWRKANQKLRTRPVVNTPTLKSFGGRSFLDVDLHCDDARTDRQTDSLADFTDLPYNDSNFFYFIQTEDAVELPSILEDESQQPTLNEIDSIPLRRFTRTKPGKEEEVRRNTLSVQKTLIRRNKRSSIKREFGKGLVGKIMRRSLNKKMVADQQIREQMKDISDHRTYFTYWLSFVQTVILIVMLLVYPFAPIGAGKREIKKTVLISANGVLEKQKAVKTITESFWIGPSLEILILLGAKYAPCMRRDRLLMTDLADERRLEKKTGCCRQTFNDGCIQRRRRECMASYAYFKRGTVCGQDPRACLDPKSQAPKEWGKDITEWPICERPVSKSKLDKEEFPHMHCEVTGRPCCIGTQAQCVITSKSNCEFKDGIYHGDKTLCSQVDCLASTCGLLPFEKDHPNQFYRLLLSLFLSAGITHLIINLIFNFTILRDIEKMSGWYRTAVIYIISGIGGNLWCCVLAPYEPEVGPAGANFGIISCLFVEVIQGWQYIQRPLVAIGKLCVVVLVLFVVGLLPYIDNFSHLFGFLHGFFLALIFLPYVSFGKWDRRRKRIQIVVALIFVVSLTTAGFVLFYIVQYKFPYDVSYLNCIPITRKFCENFNHGQGLEPRLTIY